MTHESTKGQQYSEIVERWTLDDLDECNLLLDEIDAAHARARRDAVKGG